VGQCLLGSIAVALLTFVGFRLHIGLTIVALFFLIIVVLLRWTRSLRQRSGDSKVGILPRFAFHCASSWVLVPMVLRWRGFAKRVVGSAEHFGFGKMVRPAKRRRALLESNPLRNSRRELIAWPDGKFTRTFRPAVFREPRNRFP
jgi:hypothetical protein